MIKRTDQTDKYITLTDTTETTCLDASGASGLYVDLLGVLVSNDSGSDCAVDLRDAPSGDSGAVKATIQCKAGQDAGMMIPADYPLKQAAANKAWTATIRGSADDVRITCMGVKRAT